MSAQPSGNTSARQTESSAAESSEASADPGVAIESVTAAELAEVRPSLFLQDLHYSRIELTAARPFPLAQRVFACNDRVAYLAHVAELIKREEEPALIFCFQELEEVAQSAGIDLAAPHPPVRLAEPLGAFRTDAGVPAFPCATSGDIDTLSAVFSTLSALTRLHIATPANQKCVLARAARCCRPCRRRSFPPPSFALMDAGLPRSMAAAATLSCKGASSRGWWCSSPTSALAGPSRTASATPAPTQLASAWRSPWLSRPRVAPLA